jgi:hypothetical protein
MAFCTECGATVPDGTKFCIECGKPVGEAAQPIPAMAAAQAAPAPQPTPAMAPPPAQQQVWQAPPVAQPTYAYPAQQAPVQPVVPGSSPDGKSDVISTGGYFLTLLLFSLPLIGWIACIVMAFVSGNRNRRNLARAMLIFLVIGLILSIVMYFVGKWAMEALMEAMQPYVSGISGGMSMDMSSMSDLLGMLS